MNTKTSLEINATGDFPDELLDYVLQSNVDPYVLSEDRTFLHLGITCVVLFLS